MKQVFALIGHVPDVANFVIKRAGDQSMRAQGWCVQRRVFEVAGMGDGRAGGAPGPRGPLPPAALREPSGGRGRPPGGPPLPEPQAAQTAWG